MPKFGICSKNGLYKQSLNPQNPIRPENQENKQDYKSDRVLVAGRQKPNAEILGLAQKKRPQNRSRH